MAVKSGRDLLVTELKAISKDRNMGLTKKQIEDVLITLKEGIIRTMLAAEDEITIDFPGLLAIEKRFCPAQERTNPATQEKFMDKDKFTAKVKTSNSFKTKIKEDAVLPASRV